MHNKATGFLAPELGDGPGVEYEILGTCSETDFFWDHKGLDKVITVFI